MSQQNQEVQKQARKPEHRWKGHSQGGEKSRASSPLHRGGAGLLRRAFPIFGLVHTTGKGPANVQDPSRMAWGCPGE